jgi:hypothetical protein
MMPVIQQVRAGPDLSVEILWQDGETSVVSFPRYHREGR